jgi:hypothetical protein
MKTIVLSIAPNIAMSLALRIRLRLLRIERIVDEEGSGWRHISKGYVSWAMGGTETKRMNALKTRGTYSI